MTKQRWMMRPFVHHNDIVGQRFDDDDDNDDDNDAE